MRFAVGGASFATGQGTQAFPAHGTIAFCTRERPLIYRRRHTRTRQPSATNGKPNAGRGYLNLTPPVANATSL